MPPGHVPAGRCKQGGLSLLAVTNERAPQKTHRRCYAYPLVGAREGELDPLRYDRWCTRATSVTDGTGCFPEGRRPPPTCERKTVTRRPFESCKPETATPSLAGKSNAIGHVPARRREQSELDPNRCDERTCASEDNISFSPPGPE